MAKSKQDYIDYLYELGAHNIDETQSIQQIKELIKEREEQQMVEQMTPYDYFQHVKSQVQEINKEEISKMYTSAMNLMDKYKHFGQEKAEKRLAFHIKTLLREYKLVDLGINKFVYKDDITNFIDNISKKPVKIIEMKNYPREIPSEMIEVVDATRNIFDEFYIIFTDYSEGELQKVVEKERDPILFGGFNNKSKDLIYERFYYLGDWEDEYCDLTLDKLIEQTSQHIVHTIEVPIDDEQLISQLNAYEEPKPDQYKLSSQEPKKSLFKKVRSFLHGNKDK